MASGPFVVLRDAQSRPLLAWGNDSLVERAFSLGYRAIVLTCAGCTHPGTETRQPGLRVMRCGYQDRGTAEAVAEATVQFNRCAPVAAALVRQGVPVLVTCAAGENRSTLMTARIMWLVTGHSGQAIYEAMGAATPQGRCGSGQQCFTNGVFGRLARSWPAREAGTRWGLVGLGLVAALLGAWMLRRSLSKKQNPRRRRRKDLSKEHGTQVLGHHLRIQRRDHDEVLLTWSEMQQLKNEVLGTDVEAIEVYPTEDDVINEVNLRHLWAIPPGTARSLGASFHKPNGRRNIDLLSGPPHPIALLLGRTPLEMLRGKKRRPLRGAPRRAWRAMGASFRQGVAMLPAALR